MGACYPLTFQPMVCTEINETTSEKKETQVTWMIFPDEVEVRLRTIMTPYGKDGESVDGAHVWHFLKKIEFACRNDFCKMPWAMVFYPREYSVSGHFLSIRTNAQDMRFSNYSLLLDPPPSFDPAIDGVPPLSFLWLFSKSGLSEAAKHNSPLLNDVWETLADKPADSSWVVFPDALDRHWVEETSKNDSELFFQHIGK